MTKLTDLISFEPLEVFTNKPGLSYPEGPDPLLVMGVELEIENTSERATDGMRGFKVERDGSLRNNGLEFITYPMRYNVLSERLERFFAANEFNNDNYSERCSVHVHANCRDLTLNQIASIVLIYQVVEKLLFKFIGDDRDKNIFCVPLSETSITYRLIKRIADSNYGVFRDWNKYTALNLLPLCSATQGTIEFRHMGGTCNVEFIKAWLRIICRIFAAVRTNDLAYWIERLSGLNSNSQYAAILVDIFKEESSYLITPGYESLLEEGVLLLKYSLIGDNKIKGQRASAVVMDELTMPEIPGPANITAGQWMFTNATQTAATPFAATPFDAEAVRARMRDFEQQLNANNAERSF